MTGWTCPRGGGPQPRPECRPAAALIRPRHAPAREPGQTSASGPAAGRLWDTPQSSPTSFLNHNDLSIYNTEGGVLYV